jgi:hypothetical protein
MDPRMREDDGKYAVIPAKPALDPIGGQESIPVFFPTVKPHEPTRSQGQ